MRFRKRPVEVEAMQFKGNHAEVATFLGCHGHGRNDPGQDCIYDHLNPGPRAIFIQTLEGLMRADLDDWIIRGVKGEFYPVKPDIFAATYEPLGVGA